MRRAEQIGFREPFQPSLSRKGNGGTDWRAGAACQSSSRSVTRPSRAKVRHSVWCNRETPSAPRRHNRDPRPGESAAGWTTPADATSRRSKPTIRRAHPVIVPPQVGELVSKDQGETSIIGLAQTLRQEDRWLETGTRQMGFHRIQERASRERGERRACLTPRARAVSLDRGAEPTLRKRRSSSTIRVMAARAKKTAMPSQTVNTTGGSQLQGKRGPVATSRSPGIVARRHPASRNRDESPTIVVVPSVRLSVRGKLSSSRTCTRPGRASTPSI